jgi:BioD-like phosphotransacetylase family protein
MKSIYIASIESSLGKTALCLTLGKRLQADGYKVGYLKPLSLQPWRTGERQPDEDAAFVKESLMLATDPLELTPIIVTSEFLTERLQGKPAGDLAAKLKNAFDAAGNRCDVLIVEGGASLQEGYLVGLPTTSVPRLLGIPAVLLVQYYDEVRLLDDILAVHDELGASLAGIVLNRVPTQAKAFISQFAEPYLAKHRIPLLGVLPEVRGLSALTVGDLANQLNAEIVTKYYRPQVLVETLTVGAMTAETAREQLRKYPHQAVITGGDRTDIQLAALEASTTALILTGNLRPNPLVVKQAEEFGVSILLVRANTMETIEKIESIYGKTRLGQPSKLKQFEELSASRIDFKRLYQAIGI